MSTAGQEINDGTEQAITYAIGHEMSQLGTTIHRYIVEQESASRNRALALHRGYARLQADLVPEMLSRLITHCLDFGLLDADLITHKIRTALEPQLKALGQSVGVSHQSAGAGTTTRQIMNFQGWVGAFCAAIPVRVHVAVEKRRHMAPPVPVIGPGGHVMPVLGGAAQVPNSAPANSATTQEPAPPPPPAVAPVKTLFWKTVERASWMAAIVGVIIAAIALIPRNPAPSPSLLTTPVPSLPIAAPPSAPPPGRAAPQPAAPEQPKLHQLVKHAKRPVKKADAAEPKTDSTPPLSPAPETAKTPSVPVTAVPAPAPAPVAAATPVPTPPPKPAAPPPARPAPPPEPDPLIDNYGDTARANSPGECPKILKMCEDYFGGAEFECKFAYQQCKQETASGKDYYWWSAGRTISYGAITKGAKISH